MSHPRPQSELLPSEAAALSAATRATHDRARAREAVGIGPAPLRVLFASTGGTVGGAERVLLDLMSSMRRRSPAWALRLLSPAEGQLLTDAQALGVATRVERFPASVARLGDSPVGRAGGRIGWALRLAAGLFRATPPSVAYLWRLRRALRDEAPDVVHTNGLKMHLLCALAAPRAASVVWHVHDYVTTRPVMARALRVCARRVAAVVANSESVAEDVRRLLGARVPVHTVYNGVDLARFAPVGPSADLDALAGLPPAPPGVVRVGLVATFATWKGHDVFLRALAALPSDTPVRGYVVGGALYETARSQRDVDALRHLANELGVAGRVGFTGYVRDTATAMRALDVVVHASTHPEPFGLVIAEGMACGRPVIVSDAGGAREIVATCACAITHPPGDSAALANAIARLAASRAMREELGAAGRDAAVRRFDRDRVAGQVAHVYASVRLGAAGVARAAT